MLTMKTTEKDMQIIEQNTTRNKSGALIEIKKGFPDRISLWADAYFEFEVTTGEASRKVQKRDLGIFVEFMMTEEGSDERVKWTPRLSKTFKNYLKNNETGKKPYMDRTINRTLAHLKTFAKWVHKLRPFPLGDPMAKMKLLPVGSGLEVERAISAKERRRILDAADFLAEEGGMSKDRHRFRTKTRPKRKGYRGYRNRAIVYVLIETGMRRAAVTKIDLKDVDFKRHMIKVEEKGGLDHAYQISREGIEAVQAYIEHERVGDFDKWNSPSLFLSAASNPHGDGRLNERGINTLWDKICAAAGVEGKTPHSARHAMGRHIMEKTGNVAAIQRQLGHKNATYSLQYARITEKELDAALNDR